MANKRISDLTATDAITGAELVELVQGGASVRSTITAIRATSSYVQGYPFNLTGSMPLPNSGSNYVLLQYPTASLMAAFYNYVARSGSNMRVGNISAGWSGSNILYSDTSTDDLGDTSDLYVFPSLSTEYCQLLGYSSSSVNWTVSARGTYL